MRNQDTDRLESRIAALEGARRRERRLGAGALAAAAVLVLAAWSPIGSQDTGRVVEISAGANHTCARTAGGEIYCG
jgi:hypothetical protein